MALVTRTPVKPVTQFILPAFSTLNLLPRLNALVVDQPHITEVVNDYISLYYAGLAQPSRPIGVMLFVGTTGTGKTYTAECLAEILHGDPKKFIKINGAEYAHSHEVAKLIGSPPGYHGHKTTKTALSQELLDGVTSTHCDISIVVLDEIEKADQDFRTTFLEPFDKASLTLGTNKKVDFSKTLFILTSNFGMTALINRAHSSFNFHTNKSLTVTAADRSSISEGLTKSFSSEFINRIDEVLFFDPISPDSLNKILDLHITKEHSRLVQKGIHLYLDPAFRAHLHTLVSANRFGARGILRLLQQHLLIPAARAINSSPATPPYELAFTLATDSSSRPIPSITS